MEALSLAPAGGWLWLYERRKAAFLQRLKPLVSGGVFCDTNDVMGVNQR